MIKETEREVNQKQNKRIHMGFFYYGKRKLKLVAPKVPKLYEHETHTYCRKQLGVWGCCKLPSESMAEPWWGLRE